MKLEENQTLEEKVVVTLYEVNENGNHIDHDSPCIGAYRLYGRWEKDHGLYSSEQKAEYKKQEVIKDYLSKPDFEIGKNGQPFHGSMNVFVGIKTLTVEKNTIEKKDGEYFYDGKIIY